MDKFVLSQYCDIQTEIKELRRLIESTKRRLGKIEEEGMVSDVVTGGMGGTQRYKVQGIPDPEYREVKRLLKARKERLETKESELLELVGKVEEYIDGVDRSEIRTIMRLRFLENMTWVQTAHRMNGLFPKREYTPESCRKKIERYFNEQ